MSSNFCVEKLIQQTSPKAAPSDQQQQQPPLKEMRGTKRKRTSCESENASPKKKRVRTVYSKQQLFRLQTLFSENPYPDQLMRESIADELAMTERKIHTWFQNRRTRERKRGGNTTAPHLPMPQPLPPRVTVQQQQQQPLLSTGVTYQPPTRIPTTFQQLPPLPASVALQPLKKRSLSSTPSPVQHDPSMPAYFPLRAAPSPPSMQRIYPATTPTTVAVSTATTPSYMPPPPSCCYRMTSPHSTEHWHYSPPSTRCISVSPPLSFPGLQQHRFPHHSFPFSFHPAAPTASTPYQNSISMPNTTIIYHSQ